MRALAKFSALLGLVLLGTSSFGVTKAHAQGFSLGIATPGLAVGVGSGNYGYGGYYPPGYGVGYPGGYYGAYPYVAPPVIVPPPVIVRRPAYGGYGYGYGRGYGHGGYRPHHGGYPHHRR